MNNTFEEIKAICLQRTDLDQGRLHAELGQIEKFGLTDTFCNLYTRKQCGIENKVNSLIAFVLGITKQYPKGEFQPHKKFEIARVALPDIDLDFTDRRRDEVIEYVTQKYGRDRVAQIITFGTMAARAVIRDVGRALGYPYAYCDQLAKIIPFGSTLGETLKGVHEFKEMYETDSQAKRLIDLAQKLEGVARHASTHACGVVISADPLTEYVPLQHPTQDDKTIVTQYEMHAIEDLGLLKMDFLGLKNLTIIEDTLARIYVIRGEKVDIENIPFDNQKTYRLLQKANTTSIFQLESEGMKRYLKELKPTEFEDIVAMVALHRPGPIQFIPDYIARKHGKKTITYLHPKLKPILEKTQGICIYQEELMQIARDLAGFSLAEADVLRKAVGKKIKTLLDSQHGKFVTGTVNNGISKDIAQKIWEWILPFAQYGFNKSHSSAYAMIAYQTAYLKANYPVEFMASALTSEKTDVERIAVLIGECKKMEIEVLPPNINESLKNFTVVPDENKIRFGLLAIKNVGEHIVDTIVAERKTGGSFQSMGNFISRVGAHDLNKKSLESLIKTGAFDEFAERNQLLHNMERLLEWARETKKSKANGQQGLFDKSDTFTNEISLLPASPVSNRELLNWEKELLGLYVTSHPLEDYRKIFEQKTVPLARIGSGALESYDSMTGKFKKIRVGVIISDIRKIITKTGKPMLFLKVEDLTDKIEVVTFPTVLEKNPTVFQKNKIVFISGRLDNRNGETKLIAEEIEEVVTETT